MMKQLRESVWKANLDLVANGLVTLTFGNASGFDPERELVVIKPSGVDYDGLKPEHMVVVDLKGNKQEGGLNPSSDTPTHLHLYRSFAGIRGVVHTHSDYATLFAQAGRAIPCLGTTHADHFFGDVPLTRWISAEEVRENYESHTGSVIVERFQDLDPLKMPAALVVGHGPFTWGRSPEEAVINAVALEKTARMAYGSLLLDPGCAGLPDYLLRKHYLRKHGPEAYYGQKKGETHNE